MWYKFFLRDFCRALSEGCCRRKFVWEIWFQDGVENASVSLRQPCCGLFACTATSRLVTQEEEKRRGKLSGQAKELGGNWFIDSSVPERKQTKEPTKDWGSNRHIICWTAGLVGSKTLASLLLKKYGSGGAAKTPLCLCQLKLTQERIPRVPLHINSTRRFRLGGDLYRHHHHYNTCARGLCDVKTNTESKSNRKQTQK